MSISYIFLINAYITFVCVCVCVELAYKTEGINMSHFYYTFTLGSVYWFLILVHY